MTLEGVSGRRTGYPDQLGGPERDPDVVHVVLHESYRVDRGGGRANAVRPRDHGRGIRVRPLAEGPRVAMHQHMVRHLSPAGKPGCSLVPQGHGSPWNAPQL